MTPKPFSKAIDIKVFQFFIGQVNRSLKVTIPKKMCDKPVRKKTCVFLAVKWLVVASNVARNAKFTSVPYAHMN